MFYWVSASHNINRENNISEKNKYRVSLGWSKTKEIHMNNESPVKVTIYTFDSTIKQTRTKIIDSYWNILPDIHKLS